MLIVNFFVVFFEFANTGPVRYPATSSAVWTSPGRAVSWQQPSNAEGLFLGGSFFAAVVAHLIFLFFISSASPSSWLDDTVHVQALYTPPHPASPHRNTGNVLSAQVQISSFPPIRHIITRGGNRLKLVPLLLLLSGKWIRMYIRYFIIDNTWLHLRFRPRSRALERHHGSHAENDLKSGSSNVWHLLFLITLSSRLQCHSPSQVDPISRFNKKTSPSSATFPKIFKPAIKSSKTALNRLLARKNTLLS